MPETADASTVDLDPLRSVGGRGIMVNYAAQLTKFVAQLAYQIAIARLLIPEQFGVVAMASPVIAFIALVADLGIAQAAIQRREITNAQMSSLFWANLGLTVALSSLVIVVSPAVARFYGEPAVGPVLAVLSVTSILAAFGSQHLVLLNRRLRFGTIAAIDLVSFAAGASTSLAAAILGFGVWAIVLNQVVVTVVMSGALWLTDSWRPSLPTKLVGLSELMSFGANVALANTSNFFARNVDNVLIGKVWGESALGAYDRAYKLLLLPLSQLTAPMAKVAVPLLSRAQDDANAYRRAYFLMLELVLGLTYPAAIMALVAHDQLIRVLLGEKWMASSPIFAILAIGALFAPISNSMSWLLVSQGRTGLFRNYSIVSSICFAIGIVAGLPWGPVGVAFGYIGVGLIQGPVTWVLVTREGPVDGTALWNSLFPFVVATLPVLGVTVALQLLLPIGLPSLCLILTASYVACFVALLAQRRTRESLIFLFRHFREIVQNNIRL